MDARTTPGRLPRLFKLSPGTRAAAGKCFNIGANGHGPYVDVDGVCRSLRVDGEPPPAPEAARVFILAREKAAGDRERANVTWAPGANCCRGCHRIGSVEGEPAWAVYQADEDSCFLSISDSAGWSFRLEVLFGSVVNVESVERRREHEDVEP
jgi:hypothetical protein